MVKIAEAKSQYTDGQFCIGVYCGKNFQGKINASKTRPTPDYKNMIFVVDLDFPISVYGQERKRVEVWTNGSDTLYLE